MLERRHSPGAARGGERAPSGIAGLDALLSGGLPRGRVTVAGGGPGAGKTLLALEALVHGARRWREPGIFVAFEESAARVVGNAASMGWDLEALRQRRLFFLDARLPSTVVRTGAFDLSGLLAGLDAKRREMGARRVVLDGIDMLLDLLEDEGAARREVFRLAEWLERRELTALLTCKGDGTLDRYGYLHALPG